FSLKIVPIDMSEKIIILKTTINTCWSSLSSKNRRTTRARAVHHSENADSYAQECSIAQESPNLTRGNVPPLRNCRISRAGTAHRLGIVKSYALECSTAQESLNLTRWNTPPLRNNEISRAGALHRSTIAES